QARRRGHPQRLLDPRRVGAREPDRGCTDQGAPPPPRVRLQITTLCVIAHCGLTRYLAASQLAAPAVEEEREGDPGEDRPSKHRAPGSGERAGRFVFKRCLTREGEAQLAP